MVGGTLTEAAPKGVALFDGSGAKRTVEEDEEAVALDTIGRGIVHAKEFVFDGGEPLCIARGGA